MATPAGHYEAQSESAKGTYMISISCSEEWKAAFPGAMIGLLEISGVDNTVESEALNKLKRGTVKTLREKYQGFDRQKFLDHPVMAAYERYYKRFDKTYHVQLQVESIVLKGKSLPDVSPLVDANFSAEVSTFVLTAGHDADKLLEPVLIDVSLADDVLEPMNGSIRPIRAGDMVMRDRHGVCCTILYGQDNRSPISSKTRHVLYVSYAPDGVPREVVLEQLNQIEAIIRLFSPRVRVEQSRIMPA